MTPPSPNVNVKQRGVTCHVGVCDFFSQEENAFEIWGRGGVEVIQGLNMFVHILYHGSFQF